MDCIRKYFCGDGAKKTSAQSKTQRKRDIITVSSDTSEDEIDKQKKMIKAMREKESSTNKNSKSNRARKKEPTVEEDSSSEDEIDKQKRMIKAKQEKAKATVKAKGQPVTKKFRASIANHAGNKKKKTVAKTSLNKTPTTKKKRRGRESDSDYSVSSGDEESSDEESVSSYSNEGVSVSNKRKRCVPSKANTAGRKRGRVTEKTSAVRPSSGKGNGNIKQTKQSSRRDRKEAAESISSSSDSEDSDDAVDSEVEREIAAALKRSSKQVIPSLLHAISWFRIILDEAHLIKDRSSSTAKAVFQLTSLNKWCLTGTPLQNRVGELFSLVRFLRLDPHSFYYCRAKDCDCKSLHYKFSGGRCDECSHTAMQHFSYFNKHILNPIKRMGYVGEGRKGMLTLKNEILDEVLLRRTKDTRADDIQLPPRIVKVRVDTLDKFEEDFYEAMYTQSQAQFNTYVDAGTILNNYAHIFDILIRLRQVVDHPYLVLHSNSKPTTIGGVTYGKSGAPMTLAEMSAGGEDESTNARRRTSRMTMANKAGGEGSGEEIRQLCAFCHEPPVTPVQARCGHVFCESCVTDYLQLLESNEEDNVGDATAVCPLCSEALSLIFTKELEPSSIADPVCWPR